MKQSIRAFALGLLSAGIVMLISFMISDNGKAEELSVDDMVKAVENKGYHVLTESEYISVSVEETQQKGKSEKTDKEEPEQAADKSANDKEKKESEQTDKPKETSYTLTVKSGMTPTAISDVLQKNGIIKNADDFSRYLEDEGYSTKVQLGEFKLNSGMSHYEIAETLTN